MIITFATQKGGTGKTTLAIAFANYVSAHSKRMIKVFDFDFQKSFYHKWKEDELLEIPKIYDVEIIDEENEEPFTDFDSLIALKESEEINIFDLAGTLDVKYSDLLIYSDFIVIPFEYSNVSAKSTLVFINFWDCWKVRQKGYSFAHDLIKAMYTRIKKEWTPKSAGMDCY